MFRQAFRRLANKLNWFHIIEASFVDIASANSSSAWYLLNSSTQNKFGYIFIFT